MKISDEVRIVFQNYRSVAILLITTSLAAGGFAVGVVMTLLQ